MSPYIKSNALMKMRTTVRIANRQIVVRGIQPDEPDLAHLARVVAQLAKDMQTAKELGISLEEVDRLRFPDTP